MVEIQYIDGTSEMIETLGNEPCVYDANFQLFKVADINGNYVLIPREFVKSVRYIEV